MANPLKSLFGGKPQPTSTTASSVQAGPQPIHVSDADFEEVILKADKLAVLDLWADWCGPCHMLAPTIAGLAVEFDGRAIVAKLDVDENPVTASRFNIMGIPTVLFIKNGKEIDRIVGVQPYTAFAARMERYTAA